MCLGKTPSPARIVMPPQPPPPAMRDEPEIAEAELEMNVSDAQEGNKRKYRKTAQGSGTSLSSSNYQGGGLNVT